MAECHAVLVSVSTNPAESLVNISLRISVQSIAHLHRFLLTYLLTHSMDQSPS